MKLIEKVDSKIWIISGPAAVGKNWSVLDPLTKLNIPNLVVQDMDTLKDQTFWYDCQWSEKDQAMLLIAMEDQGRSVAAPVLGTWEDNARKKISARRWQEAGRQGQVDAFFQQNRGKDIVLGGIGWWPGEDPLKFPEESKLIYLYRDPKEIAKDKFKRDFQRGHLRRRRGRYADISQSDRLRFEKTIMADIRKETVDEFVLYEERGWTRATGDQVVEAVVSHYQQAEA